MILFIFCIMRLTISWQENRVWIQHFYVCCVNEMQFFHWMCQSHLWLSSCVPYYLLLSLLHATTWSWPEIMWFWKVYRMINHSLAQTIATLGALFCGKCKRVVHFRCNWQWWQVKLNFCATENTVIVTKWSLKTLSPWIKLHH